VDTALEAMEDEEDFREFTAATTDEDVFTVSADGDAVAGSYSVTINQLAQAQIHNITIGGTTRFESTSTAIFDSSERGEISVTVDDGTAVTVSVDSTTTLADLAGDLDDLDGISAYIVHIQDDSDTGTEEYQLFVQAEDAGEHEGGERFSIDFSSLTHTVGTDDELQAAQNATATIAGQTVYSSSNTFSIIEGIDITAVSTGTATASISLDTTSMATKVETFVDAYNAVISFIDSNSSYSGSGTNQSSVSIGAFVGESAPRYIQQRLSSIITSDYGSALSLSSSTQRTALSQIGITTDEDTGELEFSSSVFTTALGDYQSSIESLFSDTSGSFSDSMRDALDTYVDTSSGIITSLKTTISNNVDRLEDTLEYHNTRLTKYRARLQAQFTQLESLTSAFDTSSAFLTSFFDNDDD